MKMGSSNNNNKKMDFSEETFPLPPLLIRNLIVSFVNNADKSLIHYAQKYKLLETLRFIIVGFYLFFIRFVPSFFINLLYPPHQQRKYDVVSLNGLTNPDNKKLLAYDPVHSNQLACDSRSPGNDTPIGRALSQLLISVNDIPVSSRKYEVVRSLADRIIDDNHSDGVPSLREVNRVVLSAAFERALRQLEAAVGELGDGYDDGDFHRMRKVLKAVKTVGMRVAGAGAAAGSGESGNLVGIPVEKLAAEVLWMGQKLAACGFPEEAVWRWAAARNLGLLALTADPRLQCSLVKLTAFLFKEAKNMAQDEIDEGKLKVYMQVKFRLLQSWLPLLCRASNGTDAPVLSVSERTELESVLEYIIERLEAEQQEQILSLWLHYFTHSPSSDWPNLQNCFARWCNASRKQLLLN
ncbi:uncharacterized protein LOC130955046 [Arachis stenosperma]|uniref:uncharacterized protein LOC130955046 n=1 Tax=Arachis stenosperma TaxID=217475 RepID=UPI0025ACF10A|nr:uncharacterized protein LOC130955046 [Arachis stenosperma]